MQLRQIKILLSIPDIFLNFVSFPKCLDFKRMLNPLCFKISPYIKRNNLVKTSYTRHTWHLTKDLFVFSSSLNLPLKILHDSITWLKLDLTRNSKHHCHSTLTKHAKVNFWQSKLNLSFVLVWYRIKSPSHYPGEYASIWQGDLQ